jgi:cellobiose-specific phosphotransferase system component IIC
MWTIWRERNRRTFDDEEKSPQDIKNIFLRNQFDYCTTLGGGGSCIVVFLDLLDVCL